MTGFVLDTSVVSVLSPNQSGLEANRDAIAWLREREAACFLSAITIMEIESGIQQLILSGSTRKAPELTSWLSGFTQAFADRMLAIDDRVARVAGKLDAIALSRGVHPGLADLLIAATGLANEMTILTRNLRHFEVLDVQVLDPFNLP